MWPNLFYGHIHINLKPQPNISLQTALAVECFLNTQQIIKISEAPLVLKQWHLKDMGDQKHNVGSKLQNQKTHLQAQ